MSKNANPLDRQGIIMLVIHKYGDGDEPPAGLASAPIEYAIGDTIVDESAGDSTI